VKILFLQKRPLFPTDSGGKIRTLNIVRYLARWNDMTYLCNVNSGEEQYLEPMRDLGVRLVTLPWNETARSDIRFYGQLAKNLFSRYPFNVNKDYDPDLRRRAEQLLKTESFDLVICDFVQMARNAIGLPAAASILFQHNVEAEIFQRHATTDRGWLRRKYMGIQWRKMQRFEAEAGRQFDGVIAVSDRDRDIYQREYGWRHVRVIDTAVDIDFFKPSDDVEVTDRVVFVGSMDWLPNEDGVIDFVENTWPLIRQERPQAVFQIVGRNPTPSVQQLGAVPGVEVLGTVPDVRPSLNEAAVVIVPLRIGGGTRLKIFEAMAMRKPVVSTTLGAEGLDAVNGQHIILADTPDAFADKVVELLGNAEGRRTLAERACTHVQDNYSAESVAKLFQQICEDATSRRVEHSGANAVAPALGQSSAPQ